MKYPIALAVAIYLATLLAVGFVPSGQKGVGALWYVAFCVDTGLFEEFIFCTLLFNLVRQRYREMQAAAIVALLFGLAHIGFEYGLAQGVIKILQAGLFSFCMMNAYARARTLLVPAAIHTVFDLLYFLPAYLATSALPPYAISVAPDANIMLLVGTTLLFALTAAIICRRFPLSKD